MESTFDILSTKPLAGTELTLTWKGLSCVNWECSDDSFEFVVGDHKTCRVHSVLAEFLSPMVARLRKCDPLCCVYQFKTAEMFEAFEALVSSLRTGSFQVEKSTFLGLVRLSQELENGELLSSLIGMIKRES